MFRLPLESPLELDYRRVRIFVPPAPTNVALFRSMATTRRSPSFSPTNSIVPLMQAQGCLGLNATACSLSGGGLGAGVGVMATELVTSFSCALACGGLAGVVVAVTAGGFVTTVAESI